MTSNGAPPGNAMTEVIVSKIVDEGGNVRTLRLDLPEGKSLDFLPGQFVLVSFPDDPGPAKPYSISSSPMTQDSLEITLGCWGALSERLFTLTGGETLRISQPQGTWHFDENDKTAVLASVQTGVAPLRSMIRYVLDKGLPTKIALFYEEKNSSSILFRQDLEDFARNGIEVHTTLTDVKGLEGEDPWEGPTGPVTLEDIRRKVKDLQNAAYYLCGPNIFVKTLSDELRKAGVPKKSIHESKWGDF